jgi:UDP-D-galactose:(glucosyl)LPS alpha-1,3-D-galactosyltransferase
VLSGPRVVFAVDDRYLWPLCVALVSLREAHRDDLLPPGVAVLHDGLGATAQAAVERLVQALGVHVDFLRAPSPPHQPVSEWWSSAIYLRLAIPDLLLEDRVALYLDADTVILDRLWPLLDTDVSDVCLAAVRDPFNPVLACDAKLPGWRELGLSGDAEYFNSGVMLMNLERWRDERIADRCSDFLEHNRKHARFWDQDSLNVVVADRWLRLSRRWNTLPVSATLALTGEQYRGENVLPLSDLLADERTPAVMHFAGRVKPWDAAFPIGPARALYRRFYDEARALLGPSGAP